MTIGSGWRFQNFRYCDILLYDSSNVLLRERGGNMKSPYSKWIIVPKTLLNCKSVKWNFVYDEKNFLYCMVCHLRPLQTGHITHFKNIPARYLDRFNLEEMKFPL